MSTDIAVSPSGDRFALAIEIANPGAEGLGGAVEAGAQGPGVAIGRLRDGGVEVLGVEPVRASGRGPAKGMGGGGQDDDLMPAIDRLARSVGLDPRSGRLALVGVSVGPGGYTSVRVACATGKMIASACGAGCVAVPSAAVAARALPEHQGAQRIAVALASKGETAWVQVFHRGEPVGEGRLRSVADVPGLASSGVRLMLADRHLPVSMRGAAIKEGIEIQEPVFGAAACLELTATLPAVDPVQLVPVYPREPDAVTLWRQRKPAGG